MTPYHSIDVEAESIEADMRFQCLLYHYVAVRAKMGDGTVTADDATDAFRALIAHIDARLNAERKK